MNNLEILFDLIVHPLYALRREDRTLGLAITVIIAALWSSVACNYLIIGNSVNVAGFSLNIIFLFVMVLFFVVLQVSLWHFIAEGFKGNGKASKLFLCVCISYVPFVFLAPMAVIVKFLSAISFWSLFQFFIIVWVILLQINSIKTVYGLNGSQAVLTYFIPFAVLLLILVLMLIVAGVFVAITASEMFLPLMEL